MNSIDIESRLLDMGANWPTVSVLDAVVQHIKANQVIPNRYENKYKWQLSWIGAIAAALMLLASMAIVMFGASPTLQAQVREAIAKSKAARITITSTNDSSQPTKAQIWYSAALGFRAESDEKVIVDNGKDQWSWQPSDASSQKVVLHRDSQDGMAMIGEMLGLESVPASWKQSRVTDRDTNIAGKNCQAYKIEASSEPKDGETSFGSLFLWRDPQQRVVRIQDQVLNRQKAQTSRTIDIAYDQEVDSEKFAYDAASDTTIVDADRVWEQRFPIDKALASGEAGGLMFAVHEITRCGPDMFYVVSSVRGTDEYLKAYPPKKRRLNLETTVSDVCQHVTSSVQQDCHIATLSSAEIDGVHYMWWIAAQRRFFRSGDGVKRYEEAGTKLEATTGQLRLPIMAQYRGRSPVQSVVTAQLTIAVGDPIDSFADVSKRVLNDAGLSPESTCIYLFKDASLYPTMSSKVTNEIFTSSIQSQIDWLRSYDQLGDINLELGSSRPPQ